MADKLMNIHNNNIITRSVDYNLWLQRLDTQLNNPTKQNLIIVPKVVEPTIRKRNYKTLRTSVINSPLSLPSMIPYNLKIVKCYHPCSMIILESNETVLIKMYIGNLLNILAI